MKILISFALLISLSAFASAGIVQSSNVYSKDQIEALADSVDRIIPSFKEFKKSIQNSDSYSLFLLNSCYKEIVAYVRYMDVNKNWIDAGFWQLRSNKETYVGETRNTYYYPGAYSTDNKLGWGDIPVLFQGYELFVSEQQIQRTGWGDWIHEFTCDK